MADRNLGQGQGKKSDDYQSPVVRLRTSRALKADLSIAAATARSSIINANYASKSSSSTLVSNGDRDRENRNGPGPSTSKSVTSSAVVEKANKAVVVIEVAAEAAAAPQQVQEGQGQENAAAAKKLTFDNLIDSSEYDLYSLDYQVLTPSQAYLEMKKTIANVKSFAPRLNPEILRKLLNHSNWMVEMLLESYFEDEAKLFKDAGLQSATHLVPSSGLYGSLSTWNQDCLICFETRSPNEMFAMLCGHNFCVNCWNSFVAEKLSRAASLPDLVCPSEHCKMVMEEAGLRRVIWNQDVRTRYHGLAISNFVESNTKMVRCPREKCDKIFLIAERKLGPLICACGQHFCSLCNSDWHGPLDCDTSEKWAKIFAFTASHYPHWFPLSKVCPRCGGQVFKDQDGNFESRCLKCSARYCWFCLDKYQHPGFKHDKEKCATLVAKSGALRYEDIMRSKHCFIRVVEHQAYLRQDEHVLKGIRDHPAYNLSKAMLSDDHASAVVKIQEKLCRCRKILIAAYTFTYFFTSFASEGFDEAHNDLEIQVGQLSHQSRNFLTICKNVDATRMMKVKTALHDLINVSNFCEMAAVLLLQAVQDGFEKDEWAEIQLSEEYEGIAKR